MPLKITLETRFDTVVAARLHAFWAGMLTAACKPRFAQPQKRDVHMKPFSIMSVRM
jgi:hypothetical protein